MGVSAHASMKEKDILQLLKEVPLFSQFKSEELALLIQRASEDEFEPHTAIVQEHSPGDEFYLILNGQVEVRKGSKRLAKLGVGQFFGEMALLDEKLRSADVIALEETRCLVISSHTLHTLMREHPDMALKMLAELTRRLRNTDQESVAALEQRVAARTRELSALYEVTAVASESLDLQETMERSLEKLLDALDTHRGAIFLFNEKTGKPEIGAVRDIPFKLPEKMDMVKSGSNLGAWVIEHGVPLVIVDITKDPRVPQFIKEQNPPPVTGVGVPMRAKGKVLGAITVMREVERQFSIEEVALLASIADQVGVAIENAKLHEQAQQVAVFEERQRLARDLHDSVTQSIYSVTLFAEAARRLASDGDLQRAQSHLEQLRETAQQALKELRLLVYELRPSMLEAEGLAGALRQRLSTVEERAGVRAELIVSNELKLQKSIETEIYHIAQEALNNSLKHANASSVVVRLQSLDGIVKMVISDDGSGFDMAHIKKIRGVGLTSMQERTERLKGKLKIESAPGKGTTLELEVPQEAAKA